jgi:integrase
MARQRKRSVHGGGSVFQRKDGRWEAKFKVEETGKYKSLYARTEKEAYKKLQDALFQQKQGLLATGPDQTVEQFLTYWLEDVEKPSVRLGTYLNNRVVIKNHLIPGIGHIAMRKLTARHLQMFYASKQRGGTSVSRIIRFQAVLHKALDHAKAIRLVNFNVADGLKLPKYERHKARFLTPEQARLLLQEAEKKDLDALIALALITGLRRGEVLGLRWDDIDFDNKVLRISRTVNYYPNYGFVEGKPKTESSERTIRLPQVIINMLVRHREQQQKRQIEVGSSWINPDLVFTSNKGNFILYGTLTRWFSKLVRDAGLPPMRFHDLRHSAATILLSMKVQANVVQQILGHSDVKTTLGTYGHILQSMHDDVTKNMDSLYGEEK